MTFATKTRRAAILSNLLFSLPLAAGLLASAIPAAAHTNLDVTVPFALSAGNQHLPAGHYRVQSQSNYFLSIRNVETAGTTVASTSAAGTNHDLRATRAKDARIFVTLENKGFTFRDLKIGNHNYTLQPKCFLTVTAPAGTVVYSGSSFGRYHRGDAIVELTASVNHSRIDVR